jgi:hypothetical protein
MFCKSNLPKTSGDHLMQTDVGPLRFGRYAPVDQRANVGFIHHAMGRSPFKAHLLYPKYLMLSVLHDV